MLKRGGGKFVQTLGASKSWINERPGSGLETSTGPARHIKLVYDALSPPKWRMGWPLLTQHRRNRHPWRAEAYPHCASDASPSSDPNVKKLAETWMLSTIHQPKKSPSLETSILSRSSHRYRHSVEYRSRPAGLMKAFNDVYIPFRDGHTIPKTARHTLDAFTLTSNQYYRLITDRELAHGQFISLDYGKLIFDEYTLPPHGEVIMEISEQISIQNRPKLFQASTGESCSDTVKFITLGRFSKIGFLKLGFCQHSKRSHHVHNHLNLLY